MYSSEHSAFILSPLSLILKDGISACRGAGSGIETFPLCEYVMQTMFLKMTGAQEQKMKCICWDIATIDYEYRYEFLNKRSYGECSDFKSKNGIYNDLLDSIQKKEQLFQPALLINASFLSHVLGELAAIYDESSLKVWQNREYECYKSNVATIFASSQIGQPKQNGAKTFPLFQSIMRDKFETLVYAHRNRCAHNTLSYQINKPDLGILASSENSFCNYFFRFAILVLIDEIFISLYKKYIELQEE